MDRSLTLDVKEGDSMTTRNTEKTAPKVRKAPQEGSLERRAEHGLMPSPFEEVERLFEGFFPRGWLRPQRWEWPALGDVALPFAGRMPRVDVIDRDTELLVRAELPGVDKQDLEVNVTDDAVTIKATTRHEKQEEQGDYHRCEILRGAFSRSISLPADVDIDAAKANFSNGLLELTLPKLGKPAKRRIKVE
jgi:HSP20 family protein